jgi:hypothetical protein
MEITNIKKSESNASVKLTGSLPAIMDEIASPLKRREFPGFPERKSDSHSEYRIKTFLLSPIPSRNADRCSGEASIPAKKLAASPLITLKTRKQNTETRNIVSAAIIIFLNM